MNTRYFEGTGGFGRMDWSRFLLLFIVSLVLGACAQPIKQCCTQEEEMKVTVMGYGSRSKYRSLPDSEQIIHAMRDAREDAYRNLIERAGGVRVKYASIQEKSNKKAPETRSVMTVESSGSIQRIRLIHMIPVNEDLYEAKIEADLNSVDLLQPDSDLLIDTLTPTSSSIDRPGSGVKRYHYLQEP